MTRKLFAIALFAVACAATLYASNASAVDEAPAPRAVGEDDKKPEAKGGKFAGKGKGKIDPEKLKDLKAKIQSGEIDPEKLKALKGKIDPEKLKELKEKFGKKKGEDKEE